MTYLTTLIGAALLLAPAADPLGSPFDKPMHELSNSEPGGPLERMSLNQMMRFSTLPEGRLREFQCAGVVNWSGSKAWPVFALGDEQRTKFIAEVATAVAHDVEMDREIASAMIDQYSEEPPYREQKGELESWRKEVEGDCRDMMERVRAGNYTLAPLAAPSVVDTTLAACYARYAVAAERASGEEAKGLQATADKAEQLALAGKEGDALAKAKDSLAAQVAAERGAKRGTDEQDMMQLVVCLPAMEGAKQGQEQ